MTRFMAAVVARLLFAAWIVIALLLFLSSLVR